ncbi:MAG: contractile injection system protein, VgrG/Pvc8 family [Fulvimonas sp.]|nr:contractile injection system protein, VgrG/Pvc8 family [Fulvimonas sp.]
MVRMEAASLLSALFSDVTRLYALEGEGALSGLQVERWWGREALSSCQGWTIDALSTDAGLSLEAMLGQRCALRITLADGGRVRRSGLVSEARLLGADGGLARYRLTVVPWLWLLGQGRHSRSASAIGKDVQHDERKRRATEAVDEHRALPGRKRALKPSNTGKKQRHDGVLHPEPVPGRTPGERRRGKARASYTGSRP